MMSISRQSDAASIQSRTGIVLGAVPYTKLKGPHPLYSGDLPVPGRGTDLWYGTCVLIHLKLQNYFLKPCGFYGKKYIKSAALRVKSCQKKELSKHVFLWITYSCERSEQKIFDKCTQKHRDFQAKLPFPRADKGPPNYSLRRGPRAMAHWHIGQSDTALI